MVQKLASALWVVLKVTISVSLAAPALMPWSGRVRMPGETMALTLVSGFNVGGSFTAMTESWKVAEFVRKPSLTAMLTKVVPKRSGRGTKVTVRLESAPLKKMLETGSSVVLPEVASSVRLEAETSGSLMVNGTVSAVSSSMNWAEMKEMTGGSLTGVTVTVNVRTALLLKPAPSLTVTVMRALPLALGRGVKVSVPVLFPLK